MDSSDSENDKSGDEPSEDDVPSGPPSPVDTDSSDSEGDPVIASGLRIDELLFQALSESYYTGDGNGLDYDEICNYIEENHEVQKDYRKHLSKKLRELIKGDQILRVEGDSYIIRPGLLTTREELEAAQAQSSSSKDSISSENQQDQESTSSLAQPAAEENPEAEATSSEEKPEEEANASEEKSEDEATASEEEPEEEANASEEKSEEEATVSEEEPEEEANASEEKSEEEATASEEEPEEEANASEEKSEKEATASEEELEEEATSLKENPEEEADSSEEKSEDEATTSKEKPEAEAIASEAYPEAEATAKAFAVSDHWSFEVEKASKVYDTSLQLLQQNEIILTVATEILYKCANGEEIYIYV